MPVEPNSMSDNPVQPRRICVVATVPFALNVFMAPLIDALCGKFDFTLVANGGPGDLNSLLAGKTRFVPIRIERAIRLPADLVALYELWRLCRKERFDCVHSIMPKSGLLAMLAARLAGVPLRIHTFTGQVWVTHQGAGRCLLKAMDRVLAACATHCLADSHSQREFLLSEGITRADKLSVLAQGSVCGVDTVRFTPHRERRADIRSKHGIPEDATVALYLGRLKRDKGMHELAAAFAHASKQDRNLYLLIVGPDEDALREQMAGMAGEAGGRLCFAGFSPEPEAYMAAADFFVMPSYREGFGSTILEAAACGVPSIGSRIYGLTDAIVEGQTGILVPAGDAETLTGAMLRLAADVGWRLWLGELAMARALRDFPTKRLADALLQYYQNGLKKERHPVMTTAK